MSYLTMHSAHFIYGYESSDICKGRIIKINMWQVTNFKANMFSVSQKCYGCTESPGLGGQEI